jgi:hypothetical protein
MENGHQVRLCILNLKLLFTLMSNYMKFFDFATTIFKTKCLKQFCIYSSKSSRCHKLQSRLNIGFILFLNQWHVKYTNAL